MATVVFRIRRTSGVQSISPGLQCLTYRTSTSGGAGPWQAGLWKTFISPAKTFALWEKALLFKAMYCTLYYDVWNINTNNASPYLCMCMLHQCFTAVVPDWHRQCVNCTDRVLLPPLLMMYFFTPLHLMCFYSESFMTWWRHTAVLFLHGAVFFVWIQSCCWVPWEFPFLWSATYVTNNVKDTVSNVLQCTKEQLNMSHVPKKMCWNIFSNETATQTLKKQIEG